MRWQDLLPGAPSPACRPRAARKEPFPGWYAHCRAYLALPARLQRTVSRQTIATYRRIERLPQEWGLTLDQRGAPLAVLRFIAWGQDPEERKRRFDEALAFRATTGKWARPGPAPTPC